MFSISSVVPLAPSPLVASKRIENCLLTGRLVKNFPEIAKSWLVEPANKKSDTSDGGRGDV